MAPSTTTIASESLNAGSDLFAKSRLFMVNSQIRPNKVTDPRILAAMRHLPRERFLPAADAYRAYLDEDIPLGGGRFLMEPMVLARLIQAAHPDPAHRVLVVGAGTGYGAAVLAACGCTVIALEEDGALTELARRVLPDTAPSVTVVSGPLAAGWPAGAPYDVILIEGAVPAVPPALPAQLRPETGRLLAVLSAERGSTRAVAGEVTSAGLSLKPIFDCGTPPLPSLKLAPEFQF